MIPYVLTTFTMIILALVLDFESTPVTVSTPVMLTLPSVVLVIYWLGISALIRFAIVKSPLKLGLNLAVFAILFIGWYLIHAWISEEIDYPHKWFFVICLLQAFNTLRYRQFDPLSIYFEQGGGGSGSSSVSIEGEGELKNLHPEIHYDDHFRTYRVQNRRFLVYYDKHFKSYEAALEFVENRSRGDS